MVPRMISQSDNLTYLGERCLSVGASRVVVVVVARERDKRGQLALDAWADLKC